MMRSLTSESTRERSGAVSVTAQVNHCAAQAWLPLTLGLLKVHCRAFTVASQSRSVNRNYGEYYLQRCVRDRH
jgi:ribosomal protein L34E